MDTDYQPSPQTGEQRRNRHQKISRLHERNYKIYVLTVKTA